MTYRRGPWPALGGPRSAEEGSPRPAVRGPWPTEWAPGLQTRIFSTLLYHKIKNQAGFEKIYFDLYVCTTDDIMQEYSIAKNCKPLYVRQNDQCFHRMKQNKKNLHALLRNTVGWTTTIIKRTGTAMLACGQTSIKQVHRLNKTDVTTKTTKRVTSKTFSQDSSQLSCVPHLTHQVHPAILYKSAFKT